MKAKDSQIVKGIAILMMLFHHLFALKKLTQFNVTNLIVDQTVTTAISGFFKVCVFLFVFVSAYGISIQLSKSDCSLKDLEPTTRKRILNISKKTFALIVFIFIVGSIFNLPYTASTDYNNGSILQKIVYVFFNAIGMCSVFKAPLLNSSWWYLSLAILLIVLVPVLYKLLNKIGVFSLLILIIFSYYILSLNTTYDRLPKYLLVALLGIITAKYNFFDLLKNFLLSNTILYFFILAGLFIFLVPVLYKGIKKAGGLSVFALSLFIPYIFSLSTADFNIFRFLPMLVLGIIFAEYKFFARLKAALSKNTVIKIIAILGLIISIPLIIAIRKYFPVESIYLLDTTASLAIILLTAIFIRNIPILNLILFTLGKYSMVMWLVSDFLIKYYFSHFTYSFKNVWLILVITLAAAFLFSFIFENFSRIFKSKFVDSLYSKNSGIIIFSIITTIVLVIFVVLTTNITYMTNDDTSIARTLSGMYSGKPFITHQFINIILGAFISTLYKLFSGIQWWFIYSYLLMIIGVFLIHLSIFKVCQKKKYKLSFALLVIAAISTVFLIYPLSNVSFTTVPAILGAGLVMLLFVTAKSKNKLINRLVYITEFVGFVLVLIHRKDTGFAILCFILLGFLYKILLQNSSSIKKAIIQYLTICFSFILITLTLIISNSYATKSINGTDFVEFNQARVKYIDYAYSYCLANPTVFEKTSWDTNLRVMVSISWFFMDEEINTSTFNLLADEANAHKTSLYESVKKQFKNIYTSNSYRLLIGAWLISALILLFVLLYNKSIFNLIFFGFNNVGALILFLYQLYNGRIVYRSLYVIILPVVLINVFFALKEFNTSLTIKRTGIVFTYLSILLLLIPALNLNFNKQIQLQKEQSVKNTRAVKSYLMENPDKTYISSSNPLNDTDIDVFMDYAYYGNAIFYGGSAFHSTVFYDQLKHNNIEAADCSCLANDNVYFMTDIDSNKSYSKHNAFTNFYTYLSKYNVLGFVKVDDINSKAHVYKFVFENNVDQFDSYYTIADNELVLVTK